MCGIAGILSLDNRARRIVGNVMRMNACMAHRGPDDEGYIIAFADQRPVEALAGDDTPTSNRRYAFLPDEHVKTTEERECILALSHRRLSIIDVTISGHQPMCTPDRRYWIIYNGAIYNFSDIRHELTQNGVNFVGNSDTEVLLCAYQQWGIQALQRFNGMFAFAVWDDKEKRLFLARDRIGIKPLYYTLQHGLFLFASDIKTLIASRIYKPAVDVEGLYHAMSLGVAPRPMTAFADVLSLEPGYWMGIRPGGSISKEQYWQYPVGRQDNSLTEEACSELLDYHLHKSVKRRLLADVPIGTFMSGGLDSTTVSAIASMYHPGIMAFTLGFTPQRDEYDELEQAQAAASLMSVTHMIEKVSVDSVFAVLNDLVECHEEPYHSLSPTYLVAKFAKANGVKVVLSGLGGDELLAGYGRYRRIGSWRLLRPLAPFASLAHPFSSKWCKILEVLAAENPVQLYVALFSSMSERAKKRLFRSSLAKGLDTASKLTELYIENGFSCEDPIEMFSYMDMRHYIGNHHVYRTDQFTMRFSLESRFPLLDHELVEAMFTVPSRFKLKNGTGKYLLHKVADKYVHQENLRMGKKGFRLPLKFYMKGLLRPFVKEKIEKLQQRDIFDPHVIQEYYEGYLSGTQAFDEIWQLVSVEMWMDKFISS